MKRLSLLLLGAMLYAEQNELSLLLNKLQKAEDLSNKTKQESAGYVITYTREDLDRMRIKSLKEILERIPFLRYNEDAQGLTDLLYVPFQPSQENQIKIYIDDKETSDTIFGNSLQVFSEMDLSFIDHIEIYLGAVSFTLGTEPSIAIVKLYTKDPARENATTLDMSGGSYGQKDVTFLSAKELQDFSYLFYLNHRILNRKKYYYQDTLLSRDKQFSSLYTQFIKNDFRAEFFVSDISLKPFTANAIDLSPQQADIKVQTCYGGLRYKNMQNGWNCYVYASYADIDSYKQSKEILGVMPIDNFPYILPYKEHYIKTKVSIVDAQIAKQTSFTPKFDLLLGMKSRLKRFIFKKNSFDGVDKSHFPFTKEFLVSGYAESKYLFNQRNIATISYKNDNYSCNGGVQDYNIDMFRLGYIYNDYENVLKLFMVDGNFKPSTIELIEMQSLNTLRTQHYKIYAFELQKKYKNANFSLLYSHMNTKDLIARDFKTMQLYNIDRSIIFDSIDMRYRYNFTPTDKIEIDAFVVQPDYGNGDDRKLYGAHTVLYKQFGDLDFYSAIVYRKWTKDTGTGIDVSFTINYNYNNKLSFYCKGINIFDTANKSDYYGYDIIHSQILQLNDISIIDRTFLVGLEYQF